MSIVINVMLALLVLGVCIFVHEFGHYIVARMTGLTVIEFAMGMGPKLFSWRKNEIDYSIRAFPVGGFCSFVGEEDGEDTDPHSIHKQAAWKRLAMTFAGPFMNFVLALLLAVVLMSAIGEYVLVSKIATVSEQSPAAQAGLAQGQEIVGVNGELSDDPYVISDLIAKTGADDVLLTVRSGETVSEITVPKSLDEESGRYLMGITFGTERVRMNLFSAIGRSFGYCVDLFKEMIRLLGNLFFRGEGLDQVAGIVGTVQMMSTITESSFAQSINEGATMLINLALIISMNLGLMNLLPLPALDGGRLVFLLFETITGKHLPRKAESIVHMVGLVLLMGLMVLLTGRDLLRLFGVNV